MTSSPRGSRTLLLVLLVSAFALAVTTIALGLAAGRALRERESAVRAGVLLRLSQQLENELRAAAPEFAPEILARFQEDHRAELASVVLRARGEVLARAGNAEAGEVSVNVALGPAWRGLGWHGGGQPGHPPFELLLSAQPGTGRSGIPPPAVQAGAALAATALFAFALLAAHALRQRETDVLRGEERKRLEAMALAGAGLAHRIRNPLATIKGTAQLLEKQLESRELEQVARIVESSTRIQSLVDDLLRFARPPEPQPERVDVVSLARAVAGQSAGVVVSATEAPVALVDREHLASALEELVANARAFDSGPIEIAVARRGGTVVVEVMDRGPGLALDAERAFQPYVTTRHDGTGLGLPTVAALVHANGGSLQLQPRRGGGTVASIEIPAAEAAS